MIQLTDLITPVTTDQQETNFLNILEAIGVHAKSWAPGGALRTIIRIIAGVYAGFSNLIVGFAQSGFIDLSAGGWLTLLAYYVFGVTRISATFATGAITITNGGGGIYSIVPGGLVVTSSVTGKAYTNVSAFSMNPGDVLSVPITASQIGSSSSAPPGTITVFQTVLAGLTCTNPLSVVGADAEDDPTLRKRCKNKLGTISGLGPRGAYGYAVRSATRTDGSIVNINRLSVSPSSSTGVVTIYVASPSGAPLATDIAFVVTSIENTARPDTATVNVLAANPLAISKTLTVWCTQAAGIAAADIVTLVQNALLTMISTYPIGGLTKPPSTSGFLYSTRLEGTVIGAHPSIYAVDGVGTDTPMSPGDVAVLATTINVRIITVEN